MQKLYALTLSVFERQYQVFALVLVLVLGASVSETVEAGVGKILAHTIKIAEKVGPGRNMPYHLRADKLVRDPAFRAKVLKAIPNQKLAKEFTLAWSYAKLPRFQLELERELILIKATSQGLTGELAKNHQLVEVAQKVLSRAVDNVPISEFRTKESLEKALLSNLQQMSKPIGTEPRFTFEIASGKLTLPKLGQLGSVEIKGGEVNLYLAAGTLSALIMCGNMKCLETNKVPNSEVQEKTSESFTMVQTEEMLRRASLQEGDFLGKATTKLDELVANETKSEKTSTP